MCSMCSLCVRVCVSVCSDGVLALTWAFSRVLCVASFLKHVIEMFLLSLLVSAE